VKNYFKNVLVLGLLISFFIFFSSYSEVPSDYKGKPYGGNPWPIPGKISFANYDLGGPNVAFKADNVAGAPTSGGGTAGPRANDGENVHPAFFKTNSSIWDRDTFYAQGVSYPNGVRYPDPADTSVFDWYIGAAHASDWYNVTIYVPKAGKYWISSIWTAMNNTIQFHISFNGVNKTGTINLPGTNSYHAWRLFKNFASVQLDSGTQVMQFYCESIHINSDFIYLSDDSAKYPTEIINNNNIGRKYINFSNFLITQNFNNNSLLVDCLGRKIIFSPVNGLEIHKNLNKGVYFIEKNNFKSKVFLLK
jgi:hypothetical protein